MSEEEKKAIEVLEEAEDRLIKPKILKDVKYTNEDFAKAIDTILNLIDKQQKEIEEKTTILLAGAEKVKQLEKEIEELKEKNTQLTNYLNDSYYVSADKIRELIKKYQEKAEDVKQKYKSVYAYKDDYLEALAKIEGYQELLEENDE